MGACGPQWLRSRSQPWGQAGSANKLHISTGFIQLIFSRKGLVIAYQVHRARHVLSAELCNRAIAPGVAVDTDLLRGGARRIPRQVVEWLDGHGRVGGREHGVGQIARVRHVVHAQVEPDNAAKLVSPCGQRETGKERRAAYRSCWSRDSPSKYLAKSTAGLAGSSRLYGLAARASVSFCLVT